MKKIILSTLILLCSISLLADETIRVYGFVYTAEKREPAAGASIYVGGTGTGTSVRSDGYYELSFPIADTATVVFSYIGFTSYSLPVSSKNLSIQKIVYLEENAVEMDELTVSAIERNTTTTQRLHISDHIPGAAGIENILITAGVATANELSSQYSVRGGNFDENSVYVNNIEVYRPMLIQSGQQEGLSFINPDLVESVAFSAGGFEPRYGDKMASVLDIRYKKPKAFEASVSASLVGASAHIGQASKDQKFTQIHGVRYKSSNYIIGNLDSEGIFNQQFIDYQGYLTYEFSPKWEASVLGNFSRNSYNSVPESMSTTFGTLDSPYNLTMYFDGQEKDLFQTLFGAGTVSYKPNKNLNFSLIGSAFSSYETMNYDILGEYWLREKTGEDEKEGIVIGTGAHHDFARNRLHTIVQNISHRGNYSTTRNKLEWGVGIQREQISDKINEFQVRDSSGYSLPYAPNEMNVWYNLYSDNTLTSYRTQGFIQNSYNFLVGAKRSIITLTGGLRAAHWSFNNEFIFSPRATIAYFPRWKQEFSFRFSTGLYYQSPFYKEMRDTIVDNRNVTVVLNKNIKSQRSLHFILGSDYFFKMNHRPFKFTTEIFYKPADRVIPYIVDNVQVIYSGHNNAKAYAAGVDFKLFGELVPGTDSWINLTLMSTKEDIYDDDAGFVSRPNDQRFNFSVFFQDYFPMFPKFKFHLKGIYADGFPFWAPNVTTHTDKNTNRSKAYRRIDIGVSRAIVKGDAAWLDRTRIFSAVKSIQLGVEVLNLLDNKNVASYYWISDVYNIQHAIPNQLSGRMFNAKISLNF